MTATGGGPAAGTLLPGADRVLAAHAGLLPQTEQLCGPFAAHVALHAVLDAPPATGTLALAAGTRVWPHDEPAFRPAGAPGVTAGQTGLPVATTLEESGTDADPLAEGVRRAADVVVVRVPAGASTPVGHWVDLLTALREATYDVGVVANLRTRPVAPVADPGWDVGHFVVLVSWEPGEEPGTGVVGIADTYPEAGAPGWPVGCRGVEAAALSAALAAPPGRGLLLLVRPQDGDACRRTVTGLAGRG